MKNRDGVWWDGVGGMGLRLESQLWMAWFTLPADFVKLNGNVTISSPSHSDGPTKRGDHGSWRGLGCGGIIGPGYQRPHDPNHTTPQNLHATDTIHSWVPKFVRTVQAKT